MTKKPTKKGAKSSLSKKAVPAKIHHHVKMAVVPHATNDYRPHLIRRYGIVAVLILVLLIQGGYNSALRGNVLGLQAELTPTTLLADTNTEREKRDLQPLKLDAALSTAAHHKVDDMFAQQYWAHVAPDGKTPWYWYEKAGYWYAEAGENLAKNFSTSSGVLTAWMVSPTHRANVLKASYQDVGFAIKTGSLDGKQTTLVVAMYGTPDGRFVQGYADTDTSEVGASLSPMAQFGVMIQSLNPAAIASMLILLFVANIALLAHAYRKRLPAGLRKSWYRHHGVYKAVFLIATAAVIALAYSSGGQI